MGVNGYSGCGASISGLLSFPMAVLRAAAPGSGDGFFMRLTATNSRRIEGIADAIIDSLTPASPFDRGIIPHRPAGFNGNIAVLSIKEKRLYLKNSRPGVMIFKSTYPKAERMDWNGKIPTVPSRRRRTQSRFCHWFTPRRQEHQGVRSRNTACPRRNAGLLGAVRRLFCCLKSPYGDFFIFYRRRYET